VLHSWIIEAKDKKIICYDFLSFIPLTKRPTKNSKTMKTKNKTYKTPVFIPAAWVLDSMLVSAAALHIAHCAIAL
jgi:hypothetical protein